MHRRKRNTTTWASHLKIAFSVDYRGLCDDVLTFVFIGATSAALKQGCFDLICRGGYTMRGYRLQFEYPCKLRNGKAIRRYTVTPIDYNPQFLSLDNLVFLIKNRLEDQGHDAIFIKDYNKFINL
jgi:hypothetical protein